MQFDGPIEKAPRVQEWRKTYHHNLNCFVTAAWLIVLVEASSAAVEHVFSRV